MRRAVWSTDAAAPPTSSGVLMPACCISRSHFGHFGQRGGDESAKSYEVGFKPLRLADYALALDHHSEVGYIEAVASHHYRHYVFADVVDVAADGGYDHARIAASGIAGRRSLLSLDGRSEQLHGLLHQPGALDYLRQEHASFAEQVSDAVHALHERPSTSANADPASACAS